MASRIILIGLSILTIYLSQIHSYKLDPSLKFSEVIETIPIGQHFENLTINHPFYQKLAMGTLPLDQFKAMTQQDDLYVQNFFNVFRVLAGRESDPDRKAFLNKVGAENWDEYFRIYYDKFNFTIAKHMVPQVLEYSGNQMYAAKHWDLSAALATLVPCYTVWAKLGKVVANIAGKINLPNHPYQEFIDANSLSHNSTDLTDFLNFVDGYYDRLGDNKMKQDMIDAYLKSIEHEYNFAQLSLNLRPETIPPPNFSDLVQLVTPERQDKVIHHPLFADIGRGTLPLYLYKILMQQDHIYIRGFYAAFKLMEQKESDPKLKALLRKDGSFWYQFFEGQYDMYNFGPASRTEAYVSSFVDHTIQVAEQQTVAEGLAAVYPCYFLWHYVGFYVNGLAVATGLDNLNHPYGTWIMSQDSTNQTSMKRMNDLINGYYDRINRTDVVMQLRMFRTVQQSILFEYLFATGIYEQRRQDFTFTK